MSGNRAENSTPAEEVVGWNEQRRIPASDRNCWDSLQSSQPTSSKATSESAAIWAESLSIVLGSGTGAFEAVRELSFRAAPGEFLCVLGASGCGKSTLLGALAGHLRPAGGMLRVDDLPVTGPSPDRGLVFQQHTLFPWKTVQDNAAFGLKMKGVPRRERLERACQFLQLVGLNGFEDRYPAQLSGGMQQRLEIARILVDPPRLLLMDEPFGALDAITRVKMQELLLDVWSRICATVVFVTHDIDEALFLADRVLVMSPRPGRILEDLPLSFARPRRADLLTEPDFIGLKRHCLKLLYHEHGAEQTARYAPQGNAPIPATAQA